MLTSIVLLWVLTELNAPTWCFVIGYFSLAVNIIKLIVDMVKEKVKS